MGNEEDSDAFIDAWHKNIQDISKICYKRIKRKGKWTRCSRPKGHSWWLGHK